MSPDRSWAVDRRIFDGRAKLDVRANGLSIEVRLSDARFPGCELPADFRCKFDSARDRIEFEFLFGDFRASASAREWISGAAALSSDMHLPHYKVGGNVGAVLSGRGRASFNANWNWSLSALNGCYLTVDGRSLRADRMDVQLRAPEHESLIEGRVRPSTVFIADRDRNVWAPLVAQVPQLNLDLSELAHGLDKAMLEASTEQSGSFVHALAFYSSAPVEGTIHSDLRSAKHQAERLAFSVMHPRLAYLCGSDTETLFAGKLNSATAEIRASGCVVEVDPDGDDGFFAITARNGDAPRPSRAALMRRATLPIDGAVSLLIDQPADAIIRAGPLVFAGSSISAPDLPEAAPPDGAAVSFKNPRLHVIRPEDRVDLIFELRNLEVQLPNTGTAQIRRIDHDAKGQIAVYFAGQHLAEQAFFTAHSGGGDPLSAPPVKSRLSGATRLVFDVVGDSKLPFSLETLLAWERFSPSLVDPVRPTSLIATPEHTETSIEAPFRVMLSPDGAHQWLHSAVPVRHGERTELWHTRLVGSENEPDPSRPRYNTAQLRAVWSPDYPGTAELWPPPPDKLSLNARDRKDIVVVTHDANFTPTPVDARKLLLSGFGAYLDLEGHFPYDCHSGISLERWLHQATLGQDNKVVVARRGYLYPFGHRALLVKVTTREIAPLELSPGSAQVQGAYLRQRLFVVMRQRVKIYEERLDAWRVPFKSIEIGIPTTPALDEPRGLERSEAPGTYWEQTAFWPAVDGNLFEFPAIGIDWDDKPCTFSAPLIFIEYDASAPIGASDMSIDHAYAKRLADVMTAYRHGGRGTRPMNGADIAVAPSRSSKDTAIETLQINFDAADDKRPVCPDEEPQFKLVIPALQARVPSLKGVLADSENSAWFAPADLTTTKSEVFLVATSPLAPGDKNARIRLGFGGQTEKSGGIGAPSMTIGALSRLFGTIGDRLAPPILLSAAGQPLNVLSGDIFNPGDFFDLDATICGSIRLGDVIKPGLSVLEAHMPKILSTIRAPADGPILVQKTIDWETTQLQNWPSGGTPIFVTQQVSPDLVSDKDRPTRFYIAARAAFDFDAPTKPTATVQARLENFSAQLVFFDNGVIVKFRSLSFSVDERGRISFDVDIDTIDFVGPFMAFIKQIQQLLEGLLGDSGVSLEISSSGALIKLPSFNFPGITLGAFSMQNLRLGSSVELSFRSEPMRVRNHLSSAIDPCLLSVGIYGGGAHVEIDSDLRRVVRFAASFTFGAFTTLNLYIASGTAGVLGGLIYASSSEGTGDALTTRIKYTFYVHAFGSVTAYGFITVGVDFYCSLEIQASNPSYSMGTVNVSYSVKIGFFEKSFTLTYSQRFTGSGGSAAAILAAPKPVHQTTPSKLTELLSYNDWITYRRAFAA